MEVPTMAMPREDEHTTQPSEEARALRQAESENARLRDTVKHLEASLRCAAKVLAPYVSRTPSRG
jgi:hypothetical protein